MPKRSSKDRADRLADVLSDTLRHAASESLILTRLEEFLDPKLPRIAPSKKDADKVNAAMNELIRVYGGPPRLIIRGLDEPPPRYDTYLAAALDEVVKLFERARNSLCRAKAFRIGMHYLETNPDIVLNIPHDALPETLCFFRDGVSDAFWEHAETCYIRLAGYWDRVGQVLDFAFFGIRQYERDGFSAVLDRIRANTLRMHPDITQLSAWDRLWKFKKSEKEDGLQWLLSRRNLLVHSIHLRPNDQCDSDELYESAFNHLDARYKVSLAVGTPDDEVGRLHIQLDAAATLYICMIELCQCYAQFSRSGRES